MNHFRRQDGAAGPAATMASSDRVVSPGQCSFLPAFFSLSRPSAGLKQRPHGLSLFTNYLCMLIPGTTLTFPISATSEQPRLVPPAQMPPCRGAQQHPGTPTERAVPTLHPCARGGWQIEVTWGHLCGSGIALSPSQPQPCPWAAGALNHVMAHAIPGHILARAILGHILAHASPGHISERARPGRTLSLPGWGVTSAPSQAGHILRAALHPRPRLSYHHPKPWQQAYGISGIFLCSIHTESHFL